MSLVTTIAQHFASDIGFLMYNLMLQHDDDQLMQGHAEKLQSMHFLSVVQY